MKKWPFFRRKSPREELPTQLGSINWTDKTLAESITQIRKQFRDAEVMHEELFRVIQTVLKDDYFLANSLHYFTDAADRRLGEARFTFERLLILSGFEPEVEQETVVNADKFLNQVITRVQQRETEPENEIEM